MATVRENTPRAGGASPIAQMLAQRAQPPAMAAAPPQVPINGMRGMPPTPLMRPPLPPVATAPTPVPAVAGGMPQAAIPPAVKAAMMARLFGGAGNVGAPGLPGPASPAPMGGTPPLGR